MTLDEIMEMEDEELFKKYINLFVFKGEDSIKTACIKNEILLRMAGNNERRGG